MVWEDPGSSSARSARSPGSGGVGVLIEPGETERGLGWGVVAAPHPPRFCSSFFFLLILHKVRLVFV